MSITKLPFTPLLNGYFTEYLIKSQTLPGYDVDILTYIQTKSPYKKRNYSVIPLNISFLLFRSLSNMVFGRIATSIGFLKPPEQTRSMYLVKQNVNLILLQYNIQSKSDQLQILRNTLRSPSQEAQSRTLLQELKELHYQLDELKDDVRSHLQKFPLERDSYLEDTTVRISFSNRFRSWVVQTTADLFADLVYFPFTVSSIWLTVKQENSSWLSCLKEFIREVRSKNKYVLDGFVVQGLYSVLHSLLVPYPMNVLKKALNYRSEPQMQYYLDYFLSYLINQLQDQFKVLDLDLENRTYAYISFQNLAQNSFGYSISSAIVRSALFPLLTLKNILIAQGCSPLVIRNHSLVNLAKKIYSSQGLLGFYRGFSAHLALTAGELIFWALLSCVGSWYLKDSTVHIMNDSHKRE